MIPTSHPFMVDPHPPLPLLVFLFAPPIGAFRAQRPDTPSPFFFHVRLFSPSFRPAFGISPLFCSVYIRARLNSRAEGMASSPLFSAFLCFRFRAGVPATLSTFSFWPLRRLTSGFFPQSVHTVAVSHPLAGRGNASHWCFSI